MAEDEIMIWTEDGFVADSWLTLGDETPLPAAGDVIVSLDRLDAEAEALALNESLRVAVSVEPGEDLERLTPHLTRLAMVAVVFPAFGDGRAYSTARLLRERLGFAGDIRATGDVLYDQISAMRRCGITSFAIGHAPTLRKLSRGTLGGLDRVYQPASDETENAVPARSWARRPAVADAG